MSRRRQSFRPQRKAQKARIKFDVIDVAAALPGFCEKILRDAREASNRMKDEAQLEAKKAADRIIEDARVAIQTEKATALREVKALVANLSLEVAGKILQKNLSSDQAQKTLSQEYIKDLKLN